VGSSATNNTLQILAHSQPQQAALGKLLGGHGISGFLIHSPGPGLGAAQLIQLLVYALFLLFQGLHNLQVTLYLETGQIREFLPIPLGFVFVCQQAAFRRIEIESLHNAVQSIL